MNQASLQILAIGGSVIALALFALWLEFKKTS
jgi:hypothetical protein